MKRYIVSTIAIFSSLFLLSQFVQPVEAITATSPVYGLTLSPAIEQLNLTTGQTTATFNSLVTNNTKSPLNIVVSARNFSALNETGSIGLLPVNSTDSHGLANWLRLDVSRFSLTPGSSQIIPVTVYNIATLSPGGHYASLEFRVSPATGLTSGNQISTNSVVSSLVFLTTAGNVTNKVKLEPLQLSSFTLNLPTSINLVINNTGNDQTAPSGLVTLNGPTGAEVARGILNAESALVLPGTSRLYTVPLTSEAKTEFPGIYTIHISYEADSTKSASLTTSSFLYINEPIVIGLVLIIVIGLIVLVRHSKPFRKYVLRSRT